MIFLGLAQAPIWVAGLPRRQAALRPIRLPAHGIRVLLKAGLLSVAFAAGCVPVWRRFA